MNKIRFWIPLIVGVLLTPVFFYASTLSDHSAASHAGGGFQMIFFYPVPFLLAMVLTGGGFLTPAVNVTCIGLAIIQFPFFGFLIGYAQTKKGSILFTLIKALIWFHVIVSLLFLLLVFVSNR